MSQLTQSRNGLDVISDTLAARYAMDARGRICASLDEGRTPRFVLGRARYGCVWRFRFDLPSDLVQGIGRLAGREPGLVSGAEGPIRPPERLVMIERLLAGERRGAAVLDPISTPASASRGDAVTIPEAGVERLYEGNLWVAELYTID